MFQSLLSPATSIHPNEVSRTTQQLMSRCGRQVGKAHLQRPTDLAAPSFTDIQQAWVRPIPIHCKADIVSGIFFFFLIFGSMDATCIWPAL
jgi:hypothetical protein